MTLTQQKVISIIIALFAFFAMIVCMYIAMRGDGVTAADYIEEQAREEELQPAAVEYDGEDIDERVRSIFKVEDDVGVVLFNTTTKDDASFMPIPTVFGDQPTNNTVQSQSQAAAESRQQSLSQTQTHIQTESKPEHYHQYQSLNNQQQTFKVQRSPDGKLNLVFNDPLVSLQSAPQPEQHPQQHRPAQAPLPTPRRPNSENKYRTTTTPSVTSEHHCEDGFNKSRSFCTKVSNYPDLSKLQGELSKYFEFFNEELPPTDVGLRINDDEQNLCGTRTRLIHPQSGLRLDNTWQFIVNTEEFKQTIQIEECAHEGERCQFADSFPNNYTPICKQSYVIRNLATINNAKSGTPELANEPFKIPSCCKCVVKTKFTSP